MALVESGYYEPSHVKRVTHWPAPDANGDGAEVWEDVIGGDGTVIGTNQKTDANGNPVYHYSPPEGFKNVPTRQPGGDGVTDTYVRVTARGDIYRHPQTREAIGIQPGTTLVEHADGSIEYLRDDYSRKLFADSHRKVDAPADSKPVARRAKAEAKADA